MYFQRFYLHAMYYNTSFHLTIGSLTGRQFARNRKASNIDFKLIDCSVISQLPRQESRWKPVKSHLTSFQDCTKLDVLLPNQMIMIVLIKIVIQLIFHTIKPFVPSTQQVAMELNCSEYQLCWTQILTLLSLRSTWCCRVVRMDPMSSHKWLFLNCDRFYYADQCLNQHWCQFFVGLDYGLMLFLWQLTRYLQWFISSIDIDVT